MITPERSGYLIPDGDIAAATAALDSILSDRDNAIKMGQHAAEDIRARFNWDTYVDDVVSMYSDLS